MADGVPVIAMLFWRYLLAVLMLGLWMVVREERVRASGRQLPMLVLLGVLFGMSSLTLFVSYRYIPAGLATTIVYLYPVLTAVISVLLGKTPGWQTWVAIAGTLVGVVMLCYPTGGMALSAAGMCLAALSALSYAVYLIVVNNSRRVAAITPHALTLCALMTGALAFALIAGCMVVSGSRLPGWLSSLSGSAYDGGGLWALLTAGIDSPHKWMDVLGLAAVPTMLSMLTLAISTRRIGATKTAVLGVFEPITALLIGVLAFGERMTPLMLGGVAVSIASVLLLIVVSHSRG